MEVTKHGYTVAEINTAVERTGKAIMNIPEGVANSATVHMLIELYLGAKDANKPEAENAKAASN